MVPALGVSNPAACWSKSLLPECCGPAMTQNSPGSTVQFTSNNTVLAVSRAEAMVAPAISELAPAQGRSFRMVGEVLKPGRTISVTEARAYALGDDGREKLIASMNATMMVVTGRDGIQH